MIDENQIKKSVKKATKLKTKKSLKERNEGLTISTFNRIVEENKKSFGRVLFLTVILTVILSTIISLLVVLSFNNKNNGKLADKVNKLEEIANGNGDHGEALTAVESEAQVVAAVEKSSQAVVSIVVTKDIPKLERYIVDPFFGSDFFNPFGFEIIPKEDDAEEETEKVEIGGGTGFIVGADGYIVTNRHVVEDENAEYTVITNDERKMEAKVLDRDTFLDLAVLKVDAKDLSVIKLGDSDKLKIGQTVIAIGNSLGEFRNTVSKGIISGLKRNLDASNGAGRVEELEEMIQTDAAINPGNSGGPIINLNGEAIGVNVAIAQGAENIGFAIPINEVKKIYESVKKNGKIVRPQLGIHYVVLNEEIQKNNDLKFDYGALVLRGRKVSDLAIIPGSPADKAGLLENDIILEIDGQKIEKSTDLARIIKNKEIGDEAVLRVWSKGEEKTIKVVLEEIESGESEKEE